MKLKSLSLTSILPIYLCACLWSGRKEIPTIRTKLKIKLVRKCAHKTDDSMVRCICNCPNGPPQIVQVTRKSSKRQIFINLFPLFKTILLESSEIKEQYKSACLSVPLHFISHQVIMWYINLLSHYYEKICIVRNYGQNLTWNSIIYETILSDLS